MSCPHLFFTYLIGYVIAHMKIAYSTDRSLYWVGSSKKDLLVFPDDVVSDIGYLLGVVQQGGMPPSAKHWKGEGAGILEIVEDHRGDTFRVVYTIRFEQAIYVLH